MYTNRKKNCRATEGKNHIYVYEKSFGRKVYTKVVFKTFNIKQNVVPSRPENLLLNN